MNNEPLKSEDDFTHYFNATSRLSKEVAELKAVRNALLDILTTARRDHFDEAIAIPAQWADSYKSCREHFNDPCCHVRLATTIVEALIAARDNKEK